VFGAIVEVQGTSLRARTNDLGEFRLDGIAAGPIEMQVRRLGFAPVTRKENVGPNASRDPLHIVLPSLPTTVKPVVVEAARVEYTGRLAGYYERLYRRSNGQFIAREEIDLRTNANLSQLISSKPGMSGFRLRTGGGAVRMRGRSCRPLVWLDGVPLPSGEVDLDAFPVNTLHGIELYLGSSNAPIKYTASRGQSSCGTILLWSRGRDTDPGRSVRRRGVDLEALAAANAIYTSDQVETPAELAQPLQVEYPPLLFAAGVGGTVIAEFIVGADGAIDAESFEIFSSSNPLFAEAAVDALSKATYKPAVKGGVPVRQLVQQPFSFSRGGVRTSASNQD
jgi:TonB family protein